MSSSAISKHSNKLKVNSEEQDGAVQDGFESNFESQMVNTGKNFSFASRYAQHTPSSRNNALNFTLA